MKQKREEALKSAQEKSERLMKEKAAKKEEDKRYAVQKQMQVCGRDYFIFFKYLIIAIVDSSEWYYSLFK